MDDEKKQKNYELAENLFSEQTFVAAIIAGEIYCSWNRSVV